MKQLLILSLIVLASCAHNPYETAKSTEIAMFKEINLPFPAGKEFSVYGSPLKDNNPLFSWDLGVPFGTPVTAMEDGVVVSLWEPEGGGGCDVQKYRGKGHNIKVRHSDGTVAQYLHIRALVKKGDEVKKGQTIAETANNGVVCMPNLHVSVWKELQGAGVEKAKSIPVRFKGAPDLLVRGYKGVVP